MAHQDASVKSILFALLANLGIAITKTVAAVITGSGAMLAESIHSFADCGNQGLLFLGLKASKENLITNIRWAMERLSISGRS
jgi:divalent metal cation (Fe/Co/Zn/Cd) transporter